MTKSKLSILCYHGVLSVVPNGYNSSGKHITEKEFDRHISFLSRNFEIVTMAEVEKYAQGVATLPSNCVAITFDDGFLNNLEFAHPILLKYGVPATLYVATNFISGSALIWTDELERIILEAPCQAPNYTCLKSGISLDFSSVVAKLKSLKSLKQEFKKFSPVDRDFAFDQLLDFFQKDRIEFSDPILHDFLDWEQLRYMRATGIWEIGAHTLNHNSLGTISYHEGRSEIIDSMVKVSNELGTSFPTLFSYPEGQESDIPAYAINILKDSGLHSAPSAIPGYNEFPLDNSDSFFTLRRFMVGFEEQPFPWNV